MNMWLDNKPTRFGSQLKLPADYVHSHRNDFATDYL